MTQTRAGFPRGCGQAPQTELARALEEAEKQRVLDMTEIDALLARHPRHPRARPLHKALSAQLAQPRTVVERLRRLLSRSLH